MATQLPQSATHPNNPVSIGSVHCGRREPLLIVAGPCVLETESGAFEIAERLVRETRARSIPLIFKASFDKANRTSIRSYRGPGMDRGLGILAKVREEFDLPVTTDIHESYQANPVGAVCDLLQIPAFLARQTDLLVAAARTGRAVHVKKGQFMAPESMRHVIGKLMEAGCRDILLTERGTFFGYHRLVNDMAAIPEMQQLGTPVLFDATHSVQQPGGRDGTTGGNRALVEPLARAAVALGVDGLFFETHPDPDRSPSDGPNMIPLDALPVLFDRLLAIREVVEQFND